MSIASIPTSKIKAREESERLYQEFLAKGGQPKKCQSASANHVDRKRLAKAMKPKPTPKPFDPHAESRALQEVAKQHDETTRRYQASKFSLGSVEVDESELPWRTDRGFMSADHTGRPKGRG